VEAAPDPPDARTQILDRELPIEERALRNVAQQAHARDGGRWVEYEVAVLELEGERVELFRDGQHPSVPRERRGAQAGADQRGEALPAVHRRLTRRERPYLCDDVGVAFPCEAVEEIPAAPHRSRTERTDDQASDEERTREDREQLGRDDRGRKRRCRKASLPALFVTEVTKALVGLVDRSCVHGLAPVRYYETDWFRIDDSVRNRAVGKDIGRMTPALQVEAPRRRGRPRRAGARDAILDATLELLAERGFHATTMDAIAERAGVGKNTIYRRWPAKDDLVIDAFLHFTAIIELRAGPDDDVYASLLDYARSLQRLYGDPLASRLIPGLLGELQRDPAFADAYAERVVRPLRMPVVALLERARERGELRADADPEQIADLLVGPGFLRMLFAFGVPKTEPTYPDALLDAIWHGVAAPA
jgi:AcrR family transcriptional regulator